MLDVEDIYEGGELLPYISQENPLNKTLGELIWNIIVPKDYINYTAEEQEYLTSIHNLLKGNRDYLISIMASVQALDAETQTPLPKREEIECTFKDTPNEKLEHILKNTYFDPKERREHTPNELPYLNLRIIKA